MIDIMNFFRFIYNYISIKMRFTNSSYENVKKPDDYFDEDNYDNNYINNKNNSGIYDEEYEVFISNIHTFENSK